MRGFRHITVKGNCLTFVAKLQAKIWIRTPVMTAPPHSYTFWI